MRRVERAERGLVEDCTAALRAAGSEAFVIPIAGGVAAFSGVESPLTKVAGLGFGGVPRGYPPRRSPRAPAFCKRS